MQVRLFHFVEMKCSDGNRIRNKVQYVENRDIAYVDYSDHRILGFRFYDISAIKIDGEILKGNPKNISGWYYKGKKMTLEQLKEVQTEDAAAMVYAMETYIKDECVDTGFGKYFILEKDDVVLENP